MRLGGQKWKSLESGPPLKFEKLFGSSLYCGTAFAESNSKKSFMGCSKFMII